MVIISGANSGLGLELTKIFCTNNYKVLATDISNNNLKKIKNNNLIIIKGDITKSKTIIKIKHTIKFSNDNDILLFNNAAFSSLEKKPYIKYSDIDKIISTNLISPVLLTDYLLYNNDKNISIVNILSKVAFEGNKNSLYSISKWGLRGYSESLKEIYKGNDKINIINVIPCSMKTSYWDNKPVNKEKLILINPNIIADRIYEHIIKNNSIDDLFIKKEEYLN